MQDPPTILDLPITEYFSEKRVATEKRGNGCSSTDLMEVMTCSWKGYDQGTSLQVDFDQNLTSLYEAITASKWDDAVRAAKLYPQEARTWVVRYFEETDKRRVKRIMWRFLPIHSACARKPPITVIAALLDAYPDGAKCNDDKGMYPLHYACGNQASFEVISILLSAFPDAAKLRDPHGMLPIHYLACWGPSSLSAFDTVLHANFDIANAKDEDGNTPLDLAQEGEYPEREVIVATLKNFQASPTPQPSNNTSTNTISVQRSLSEEEKKEQEMEHMRIPLTPSKMNLASPMKIIELQNEINTLPKLPKLKGDGWKGRPQSPQHYQKQLQEMKKRLQDLKVEVKDGHYAIRGLDEINTLPKLPKYKGDGWKGPPQSPRSHKKQLQEMQKRLQSLEAEVKDRQNIIRELENKLQSREDEIYHLNGLLEHSYQERDGLRHSLADLRLRTAGSHNHLYPSLFSGYILSRPKPNTDECQGDQPQLDTDDVE